jgi:MFS superfamily sulfate permease-like transporter
MDNLDFNNVSNFMGIFILGGIVFLVAFTFFKIAAFRKTSNENTWRKLALVALIDYLVLVIGTLGTGILFMTLYSMGHPG